MSNRLSRKVRSRRLDRYLLYYLHHLLQPSTRRLIGASVGHSLKHRKAVTGGVDATSKRGDQRQPQDALLRRTPAEHLRTLGRGDPFGLAEPGWGLIGV